MKILAFDASTRFLSIAIADGKKVLRYRNLRKLKFLSNSIVPSFEGILKSAGLSLKKMDVLIVGAGPGSFTSLRVGFATAKALAFAHPLKIVSVSSLDAIAMNVKSDGRIGVMNDARRGLVYAAVYEKTDGVLKPLVNPSLDTPENILKIFSRYPLPVTGSFFIGDAVSMYRDQILRIFSSAKLIVDEKLIYPDARHLMVLGMEKLKSGRTEDLTALSPIYLYPEDCQVQKS